MFRYSWSKFHLGLHSQRNPCALPRVSCWVNTSYIYIHPEGSTRHRMGFRPTQSGVWKPVPVSCCCFTRYVEVNRSLDWHIPKRAFFWRVHWIWESALLLMSVLNGMVFHMAGKYLCALWRVGGMDEAEKLADRLYCQDWQRLLLPTLVLCYSSTTFEK